MILNFQVLLVFLYLLIDISFYFGEHPEENVKCDLPVFKFPGKDPISL